MKAFISYQTNDKSIAAEIREVLNECNITPFMAHKDIEVSNEWREKILDEIEKSNIFIGLWSKDYENSPWCLQEAGIASYLERLRKITTISFILHENIHPQGFANNIQAVLIRAGNINFDTLLPGIMKYDKIFCMDIIIKLTNESKNYRNAEQNFKRLNQYIDDLTYEKGKEILEFSLVNRQIYEANECMLVHLPIMFNKFSRLLSDREKKEFQEKFMEKGIDVQHNIIEQ